MTADSQDALTQALTRLEGELEQFDGVQKALKDAHQRLIEAKQEWSLLTAEKQRNAIELVETAKATIKVTEDLTGQTSALTCALIPLAKAIESVNFPLRLDKIDMVVTTQLSTLVSFQAATDRKFDELKLVNDAASRLLATLQTRLSRLGWAIAGLMAMNAAVLIAVLIRVS